MNTKRIYGKLYTETRVSLKGGLHYEELPDGRLYSNLRYPTTVKAEDIPEWFMRGRFYKNFGYISTKGVKDLVYVPNYVFNHFHKDDALYISYKSKIKSQIIKDYFGKEREDYYDYNYVIDGGQIIHFIKMVQTYSPEIDTKPIIAEIYKKSRWMIETYPDDIEVKSSDRIKYLDSLFGGDPSTK